MHLRFISFLLILTLLNCSDNNNVVKYKSFKYGWFSNEKVKFKFKLKQVEENNLFIDLRNNNDYKFSNIFLIAILRDSNSVIFHDTLEYKMANLYGEWMGKGFSNIKENRLWRKEKWKPNHKGPYFIEIAQATRENGSISGVRILDGILDIGLTLDYKTIYK